MNAESKFVGLMRDWLVSLPHDLKVAYEALDDENLSRAAREVAVGAIIYVVSPNDAVSDRNDQVVSYADDALILRMALIEMLSKSEAEDAQTFRERFSDVYDGLEDDLALCGTVMGDLMVWLKGKMPSLISLDYKGKKVKTYLDNDEAREALVEDGLVFRTDYPVDETTIGDKLKKASTITDVMRKRKDIEARARVAK